MKKLACGLLLALSPLALHAQQAAPAHAATAAVPAIALAGDTPNDADATRLITLQGALNVRNLGGLQGKRGAIPATSFVRTADLGHLTAADRDTLAARGVALDVDLRTADEESESHDALADDKRFKYVRISLLGDQAIDMSKLPPTLGEGYVKWLDDDQAEFRMVFQAIAAQQNGTVLYHCTAGKDRTGMITALLLDLAGVPRADIVHNYAVSAYYLKPMMSGPAMQQMVAKNPNLAPMMGTPPAAIEAFLDAVDHNYGGAHAYLRKIGVSEQDVTRLQVRLGQA